MFIVNIVIGILVVAILYQVIFDLWFFRDISRDQNETRSHFFKELVVMPWRFAIIALAFLCLVVFLIITDESLAPREA
jgi:amino acid transporter